MSNEKTEDVAVNAAAGRELPALVDEGDRSSVTDVNGTVARFDMTYSAAADGAPTVFGPPLRQRIPSFIYLGFAIAAAIGIFAAPAAPRGSFLFRFVVEGDSGRPISAAAIALILIASAVGTVIRAHMRGVIVKREGLEARYLLALGFPRIRKWTWAQIHRLVLDDESAMLELWDSAYARLPDVADTKGLVHLLEQIGHARAIQVTRLKKISD
ncbi:MAG: hypothetical protein ABI461_03145 [Polyangiaceae bacterium]